MREASNIMKERRNLRWEEMDNGRVNLGLLDIIRYKSLLKWPSGGYTMY